MSEIKHPHLVLWGEKDGWIAPADLVTVAAVMSNCRLVTVPGVGILRISNCRLSAPAISVDGSAT